MRPQSGGGDPGRAAAAAWSAPSARGPCASASPCMTGRVSIQRRDRRHIEEQTPHRGISVKTAANRDATTTAPRHRRHIGKSQSKRPPIGTQRPPHPAARLWPVGSFSDCVWNMDAHQRSTPPWHTTPRPTDKRPAQRTTKAPPAQLTNAHLAPGLRWQEVRDVVGADRVHLRRARQIVPAARLQHGRPPVPANAAACSINVWIRSA